MSDINISTEDISDNQSTTTHSSVYDAETEIDSLLVVVTLILNTSSELSEVGHIVFHENSSSPVTSNGSS